MKHVRYFSLAALVVSCCSAWTTTAAAASMMTLAAKADWSCVEFKTLGPCYRKTPPYVGVKVRYRQPVLLVETVKISGDTVINELRGLLGARLKQKARVVMKQRTGVDGDPSAGGGQNGDGTALSMNEAHVLSFPFTDVFSTFVVAPCEGAPDLAGPVGYISELDAKEWRTGETEQRFCGEQNGVWPMPGTWLGTWGPIYPRTGWSAGTSAPVASALSVYRAVDISSIKPQLPRVVLSKVLFVPDLFWDRMQMVYPSAGKCLRIGEDPRLWEKGKNSSDGKYVWIFWRKKECCLF
jgi:hypothetical protein